MLTAAPGTMQNDQGAQGLTAGMSGHVHRYLGAATVHVAQLDDV